MLRSLALAAVALAACGGNRELPPLAESELERSVPPPDIDAMPPNPTKGKVPCDRVVAHVTELNKRELIASPLSANKKVAALGHVDLLRDNVADTCRQLWNDATRMCLLAARNDADIKACKKHLERGRYTPPPPPRTAGKDAGCKQVIRHFLGLAVREISASRAIPQPLKGRAIGKAARLTGLLKSMCKRGWPAVFRRCVLAAKTVSGLETCRKHMPSDVRALERKLEEDLP